MAPLFLKNRKQMWKLKGTISARQTTLISIGGLLFFLSLWEFITSMQLVPRNILPNPIRVFKSYSVLINEHHKIYGNLWDRLLYSLKLNMMGLTEAISISLVFGFLLGLFAPIRAFFGAYVNSSRFVPITATTGIIIAWFGINDNMKVQFLAIGIMVYMIPTVTARVQETLDVHLQTAQTLGATSWQKLLTVFFPDVLRRVSTDIITLSAISWTYINFVEIINNQGGIGAKIYEAGRQSRYEQVWALLFLLVGVAFAQDRIGRFLDRLAFPDKYKSAASR